MPPGGNFPISDIQMNASEGQLTQDVTNLQSYSGIFKQQVQNSPYFGGGPAGGSSGFIGTFFNKIGSVLGEGSHLIEGAGKWVGRNLAEGVSAVARLPLDSARMGENQYHVSTYGLQNNYISAQINQANQEYKAGFMSKSDYQSTMLDLSKQSQGLGHDINAFITKTKADEGQTVRDLISTATDVITVATAGLTSPLTLVKDKGAVDFGNFLMSKSASDIISPAEQAITKLAQNKALFNSLPGYIQGNLKASVTDTLVNGAATMASKDFVKASAINMAVKYPIAFNWLNGTGDQVYKEMQSGKYGDAVKTLGFNLGLILAGGPVGDAFSKLGPSAVRSLSGKMFGSSSFLDTYSKAVFEDPSVAYQAIKDNPELIKAFQALEATNMGATNGRAVSAAYRAVNGLKNNLVPDFKEAKLVEPKLTPQDYLTKYVLNWHVAQSTLTDKLIASGMSQAEARQYVVGRWTTYDANRVSTAVTTGKLGDVATPHMKTIDNPLPGAGKTTVQQDMLKNFNDIISANPNMAFANNQTIRDQITHIIQTSDNIAEVYSRINAISAQTGKEFATIAKGNKGLKALGRQLGKLGYVPIVPGKLEAPFIQGTQPLVTKFAEQGTSDLFHQAVQPFPVFKEFGTLLTRAGMSPQRAAQATQEVFDQNFSKNLRETSLFKDKSGKYTELEATSWASTQYRKISSYINEVNQHRLDVLQPPISNVRQLTKDELSKALDITKSQAAEVQNALMQSMLDLSFEQRGIGDKVIDMFGGKTMQKYLRIQGAGRFAWNPVFKMKLGYKTEFLTQAEVGGKAPTILGSNTMARIIFRKYYNQLDSVDSLLKQHGMYGSGMTNEAATEETIGAGAGGGSDISASLRGVTKSQRLSISGMVSTMADRVGMTPQEFLNNFPGETKGSIDSILHYNPNSSFLNSNMAKMLNVAIFPFRFNVKVSGYMLKVLGRQDWVTRAAVLNGVMEAHSFLTSEQGQVWYSQNSDVIGLLAYFTPLETLSTIAKLGGITHESLGAFGELGGLPVGFVTQLLQSEGLWKPAGQGYVNPQTGQPGNNYIPKTAMAALATAISSFVGSLFTYPGGTVGLPSKTSLLSKGARNLTGTTNADWTKVPQTNLTPEQQQFEKAVQQFRQTQSNSLSPQQPYTEPTILPPLSSGTANPIYGTSNGLPKAKRLKKSQQPVSVLPGQTAIGQIP